MQDCTYISAASALLFAAEVTRCQNVSIVNYPNNVITIIPPKDKELKKLIRESGLWDAIKPGGRKKLENIGDNEDINFCSGNNPSEDLVTLESRLTTKLKKPRLPRNIARAISEAFLNIVHHAYKTKENEEMHPFMLNRWWLYCYINQETPEKEGGEVVFLLYDKGIGISDTVRIHLSKKSITAHFKDDNDLIIKAFEPGFTSTGDPERGRGTQDLTLPLFNTEDKLLVYSGRGIVSFDCTGRVKLSKLQSYNIAGTLLEWSLKF